MLNLYLDDDITTHRLVGQLRKDGHKVVIPSECSMAGKDDPEHLLFALQNRLALVTRNAADFEKLHQLVLGCGGLHQGMLVIRAEKDRSKHMTIPRIWKALNNLDAAGISLENQLVELIHWQ